MYMMVQIVLCEYCICSVGYGLCYEDVGYAVLCTYCIVHMMSMRSCVHMVLCACWICGVVYK